MMQQPQQSSSMLLNKSPQTLGGLCSASTTDATGQQRWRHRLGKIQTLSPSR